MSFSRIFILRPVATGLLTAALLLAGLLGYRMLPVAALPQVDFPTIRVTAQLPGASPETMTASVTTPLERQLGTITGLKSMISTSSFAASVITLQFDLTRPIDSAAQDVQAAISAASGQLPKNLPRPPTYNKVNPADTPVVQLAVRSDTVPLARVQDFADSVLGQKLSQLDGVGLVTIEGGQKPAVRVRVNPSALAGMGLTLADLRTAIVAANVNQAKGQLQSARQSYTIFADDQLLSAAAYRSLIVAYRNNAPVRLGEVASVIDGVEDSRQGAWVDQHPAVLVNVQRQPGANIIETVARVRALLPKLTASMPEGVSIEVLTDRTATIKASIKEVQFTLVLTVALVVLVIFLFLRRLWATVIPSIAVPLSLIATFGVMHLAGFSLDNLSLMALTIAAGFVVDDAIVMIENIVRFRERGLSALDAALEGARQIGFTVVSLTVSLIAVFIPLLFMGGIVGRLFREFAITLSVAVVVSAIVSLTLTPTMCAYLLGDERAARQTQVGRFYKWVLDQYSRSLETVLRHSTTMLVIAAATLIGTVYLYLQAPKGFLPQQDTGLLVGVLDASPDTSYHAMELHRAEVVDLISQDPAVKSVGSFLGAGLVNPTVNSGRLYIALKPQSERQDAVDVVIRRLTQTVHRAAGVTLFLKAAQDIELDNRVSRTQYQLTLQDADVATLDRWAPQLVESMRKQPELADIASDQQNGGLEASVVIDRDTASRLGISIQTIVDALYDAFGQRQISTIFTQLNQYHVVMEVAQRDQTDPAALNLLYVRSAQGDSVPLSAVARIETGTAPLTVTHQGLFPAVTLSFNLAEKASLSQALAAIDRAKKEVGMPASVSVALSGGAAEFSTALDSQPWLILAAIFVVYIVLGILYESLIHPLTILSTLPSAGVGALLALEICGRPLDVIGVIGIILLIGIVKKNAIMMIDFALDAERNQGMEPEDAIRKACLLRFRPIMMTTMAALFGALPLALGTGTGAELRQPLGIAIVGGLLVSQLLTLYTTPVIYLTLERLVRPRRMNAPPRDVQEPVVVQSAAD